MPNDRAVTELVAEGTFSPSMSLGDVLEVARAEPWVEVVLEHGRILCRSGQIVEAFVPPDLQGLQAFLSLYRSPGRRYGLLRRRAPEAPIEPLGDLAELVRLAQASMSVSAVPVVMEGSFQAFDIREVLDVLAIGRQEMELQATREDGSTTVLVIRAGEVLSCEGPGSSGVHALRDLLADPGSRFRVTHRDRTDRASLGTLRELLAPPPPSPATSRWLAWILLAVAFVPLRLVAVLLAGALLAWILLGAA